MAAEPEAMHRTGRDARVITAFQSELLVRKPKASRPYKDVDDFVRAIVPVQRHDGILRADQGDAIHERASVLPGADDDCGMKRAEQLSLAFAAFEEVRLLPCGNAVGS